MWVGGRATAETDRTRTPSFWFLFVVRPCQYCSDKQGRQWSLSGSAVNINNNSWGKLLHCIFILHLYIASIFKPVRDHYLCFQRERSSSVWWEVKLILKCSPLLSRNVRVECLELNDILPCPALWYLCRICWYPGILQPVDPSQSGIISHQLVLSAPTRPDQT